MLTRAEIRSLAEANLARLSEVRAEGGNVHQAILDQHDELNARTDSWPPEHRERFWTMYAEEMEALKNAAEERLAAADAQLARSAAWGEILGGLIGFAVLALFFYWILSG